jgi:hypothetical protein
MANGFVNAVRSGKDALESDHREKYGTGGGCEMEALPKNDACRDDIFKARREIYLFVRIKTRKAFRTGIHTCMSVKFRCG